MSIIKRVRQPHSAAPSVSPRGLSSPRAAASPTPAAAADSYRNAAVQNVYAAAQDARLSVVETQRLIFQAYESPEKAEGARGGRAFVREAVARGEHLRPMESERHADPMVTVGRGMIATETWQAGMKQKLDPAALQRLNELAGADPGVVQRSGGPASFVREAVAQGLLGRPGAAEAMGALQQAMQGRADVAPGTRGHDAVWQAAMERPSQLRSLSPSAFIGRYSREGGGPRVAQYLAGFAEREGLTPEETGRVQSLAAQFPARVEAAGGAWAFFEQVTSSGEHRLPTPQEAVENIVRTARQDPGLAANNRALEALSRAAWESPERARYQAPAAFVASHHPGFRPSQPLEAPRTYEPSYTPEQKRLIAVSQASSAFTREVSSALPETMQRLVSSVLHGKADSPAKDALIEHLNSGPWQGLAKRDPAAAAGELEAVFRAAVWTPEMTLLESTLPFRASPEHVQAKLLELLGTPPTQENAEARTLLISELGRDVWPQINRSAEWTDQVKRYFASI